MKGKTSAPTQLVLRDSSRRKLAVGAVIIVQRRRKLLGLVMTLRAPGGLASRLHRRQQKRDQNADDGNDHEQLDQRQIQFCALNDLSLPLSSITAPTPFRLRRGCKGTNTPTYRCSPKQTAPRRGPAQSWHAVVLALHRHVVVVINGDVDRIANVLAAGNMLCAAERDISDRDRIKWLQIPAKRKAAHARHACRRDKVLPASASWLYRPRCPSS